MLAQAVRAELRRIVGDPWFRDEADALVAYSYDATPLYRAEPLGVVLPGSTAEVAAILRLCSQHGIKVIPRGSGTNLSGGTVPAEAALVLSLTRMNRLLEVDEANLTATCEPGLITAQLHQAVESLGLFYPPDPGSQTISTIGGNVAECAGGLRGLKYGVTRDYVLALEAVLPTGDILRTGGKLAKDVAGYDMTRLLVGSEGTLAVVTEVTLKLLPKPESRGTLLACFQDLDAAARTVSRIIAERIIPATLEFLDNATLRVVEDFAHVGLPLDMEAVLLIEQDGPPAVVERDVPRIAAICRDEGAVRVDVAASPAEGAKLMTARRVALSALARLRPTTILEDATVPRSAVAAMVRQIRRVATEYNLNICTFGHAGDGNLHPTCLTDARDTAEIARVEEAFAIIFDEALKLGGTITGEHGVGLAKAGFLEWKVGAPGLEVMRGIKRAFDPQGILNPGKVFPRETRRRVVVQQ
ncbi:MAG: FAD-binding oxidoreductase [Symbiobacteriia bacterium]